MAATKPYELSFEKRQQYLYAFVQSDSSLPTVAPEYLKDIAKKCTETRCTRVMIENALPQSFWVWDMFEVATYFPQMGIECTKVAIVDKFAPIEKEEFVVIVGKECGLDVHVFSELPDAEHWLIDS